MFINIINKNGSFLIYLSSYWSPLPSSSLPLNSIFSHLFNYSFFCSLFSLLIFFFKYIFFWGFGSNFMGTNFSSDHCSSTSASSWPISKPGLGDLPENCVSSILKQLEPPEICKLAILSTTFHSASLDDLVWESKLPSNYKFLVDKVVHGSSSSSINSYRNKKEIYAKLCQHNRFDGGTKVIILPFFYFSRSVLFYFILFYLKDKPR